MAYNSNIPLATDQLSQSQSDILNNFAAVNSWVNVDHGPFGAGVGLEGTHYKVSLPVQGAAPAFANPTTTNGFYVVQSPDTLKSEVYVHKQNQAAAVNIPMTASILGTVNLPPNGSAGWSYLPSGILIKWGSAPVGAGFNPNVGPNAGPNFSALFNFQVTGNGNPQRTFVVTIVNANSVTITSNPVAGSVSYFAIGY